MQTGYRIFLLKQSQIMKRKTVFIFAYYSYKDPVFQSAVLPYFTDFPDPDYRFILLTWEQNRFKQSRKEKNKTRDFLIKHNIIWHNTKWHSGSFKIFKKSFDLFWGILFSLRLIIRYKAQIIYSEGFPGAIFGYLLAIFSNRKHVVHTFEPHADAMIEAGVWRSKSWEAKLLKYFEKKIAKSARLIITATEAMIKKIKEWDVQAEFLRAPSCVDVEKFNFNHKKREDLRSKYGVLHDECIIVYMGKFGGMYMEQELFEFFQYCLNHTTIKFKFWILSIEKEEKIEKYFMDHKISKENYLIKPVSRSQVPDFLSAADLGFVAIRPTPSRRYCSPIKDGEYWACKLPIIIPEGISDDYIFTSKFNLGAIMPSIDRAGFKQVINWIEINYNDLHYIGKKARNFVIKDRNVNQYKKIIFSHFEKILAG